MANLFLNNVNNGKNSWVNYTLTFLLTWGVSLIITVLFLVLVMEFYLILTGSNGIISFENLELTATGFFISTFLSFLFSTIFLLVSLNVFHKRELLSLINISSKYDIHGKSVQLLKRIRWNKVLKGMIIWSIFMSLYILIAYMINPSTFKLNFDINSLFSIFLLVLFSIPIQVSLEELFFRGYLNQGLSLKIRSPVLIITVSSLLFGLGHIFNDMNPVAMFLNLITAFLVGIIWSIYTLMDNGIEFAIGAHFANNLIAFMIISPENSVENFGTLISTIGFDPAIDLIMPIVTLLVFLGVLVICKKKEVFRVLEFE
jgi:membrane protease YdiL (CAAX protease family)